MIPHPRRSLIPALTAVTHSFSPVVARASPCSKISQIVDDDEIDSPRRARRRRRRPRRRDMSAKKWLDANNISSLGKKLRASAEETLNTLVETNANERRRGPVDARARASTGPRRRSLAFVSTSVLSVSSALARSFFPSEEMLFASSHFFADMSRRRGRRRRRRARRGLSISSSSTIWEILLHGLARATTGEKECVTAVSAGMSERRGCGINWSFSVRRETRPDRSLWGERRLRERLARARARRRSRRRRARRRRIK